MYREVAASRLARLWGWKRAPLTPDDGAAIYGALRNSRPPCNMGEWIKRATAVREPVIIGVVFGDIVKIRLIAHAVLYRRVIIGAFYDLVRILILALHYPSFLSPFLHLSFSFTSFQCNLYQ